MRELRDRFRVKFPATELDARAAIAETSARLRGAGVDPDRADEIEIALAEAVNNVVEHAYSSTGAGNVHLHCSLRPHRLDIRICDTGTPLPDERLPPGLAADLNVPVADLPEGGFGWFLIRELTSEIRYDRCGSSNHLSLRFDLQEPSEKIHAAGTAPRNCRIHSKLLPE